VPINPSRRYFNVTQVTIKSRSISCLVILITTILAWYDLRPYRRHCLRRILILLNRSRNQSRISEIGNKLEILRSTLSHHLEKLQSAKR
jgi:DNA-binding MarR family transcriptional regulator